MMRNRHSGDTEADLVTIRIFASEFEANLARSRLQAAGIGSMIRRDDCGGMNSALSMTQGIKLVVRSDDAKRAAAALTDEHKNSN
jgi:hypothetical protein